MGKIFFPVSVPKKINWISELFWFWTLDVSRQRLMKSLLPVCPSICPSAHPSLRFVKIVSLVFSDIVYHDSWPWYLVTEEFFLKIFEKKVLAAQIWAKWAKIGPEPRFFVIFSSLVHYFSYKLHKMIAWNNV